MHLWLFQISDCQPHQDFLQRLSPEEVSKSCKFAFERDRKRYVLFHAFLREVLARYCSRHSQPLEIAYGEFGKPFLKGANKKIHFSFSHADDVAVCALFWKGSIGIDIEKVQNQFDFQQIADSFFSEQEKMILKKIPDSQKAQFFYSIWTGKEAYGKFLGKGIQYSLDQVFIPVKQASFARDRFVGINLKELHLNRFAYEKESQPYIISSVTEQKIQQTTLFSCVFDEQKSFSYELVRTY